MKKIIFLYCLVQPFIVLSQSIKLKILNRDDKSVVQYASVFLLNSKTGYYTNELGEVNIDLTSSDTLSISCTGYENKKISTNLVKKQSIIYLNTKTLNLDEIIVKSRKKNKYKIEKTGNYWEKQKHFVKPVIGTQWAIHLKNKQLQDGIIETLNFKFTKGEQTKISRIMVRLYSYSQNCNCPFEEILHEAIIQDIIPKQTSLTINILERNIKLPQKGLFVSLEILGFVSNGLYEPIKFGYKVEPVLSLSKEGNEHENWIKSPFIKGWQKFFVKDKLMFGATILY